MDGTSDSLGKTVKRVRLPTALVLAAAMLLVGGWIGRATAPQDLPMECIVAIESLTDLADLGVTLINQSSTVFSHLADGADAAARSAAVEALEMRGRFAERQRQASKAREACYAAT